MAPLPSLPLLLSALQSLQRAGGALPLGCPALRGLKVMMQSREANNTAHLRSPCCAVAGGGGGGWVPVTVLGSRSVVGEGPAVLAVSRCSLSVCGRIAERYMGAGLWGKRRHSSGSGSGEELGLLPWL